MKILFIASNTRWEGSNVALYNLIKGLFRNHKIKVFVPESSGIFISKLQELNVNYIVSKYSLTIYPKGRNFIKNIYRLIQIKHDIKKAKIKLSSVIEEFKPDIIHTNVGPLDLALDVCKQYHIPHIWHQREYQNLDFNICPIPSMNCFKKKIHSTGNYNIAITKGIYDHWKLRPNDRIIYDGVFDKEVIPTKKNQKKKYFLFVGRIEEAKGLHLVLHAFSKFCIKNTDYSLFIAGAYNEKNKYKKLCDKIIISHNLQQKISFLGNRKDIYQLMSEATALIVASKSEGFGFITTEAMLNDCLVIGKNCAGTKEQFDNGKTVTENDIGLRFLSEEELIQQMLYATQNDTSQMRSYAFSVVTSKYTIDKNITEVENYYKFVIQDYMIKKI